MSGRGEAVPPFSLPVWTRDAGARQSSPKPVSAPPAERATLTAGEAGAATPPTAESAAAFRADRPSAPAVSADVTPDWKPQKRKKATTKQWGILRHGLNRHCVVCGDAAESAHHIVRRSQGGDDVPANLLGLCGHGTRGCHGLAENRHRPTLTAIRYALTPEQVAYVLMKKGEAWLDRAYPKPDCMVCDDLGCEFCKAVLPKEAA